MVLPQQFRGPPTVASRTWYGVDGGVNPRKSGDDRKSGTRIAAPDQTLLAVFRSDANGCSVALCQRRQPPKAGAVGQRLQRVAGQSSWTIKNDGWFRIAQVRLTRERPYAKTVRFSKRTHRRLRADSRRRQHMVTSWSLHGRMTVLPRSHSGSVTGARGRVTQPASAEHRLVAEHVDRVGLPRSGVTGEPPLAAVPSVTALGPAAALPGSAA